MMNNKLIEQLIHNQITDVETWDTICYIISENPDKVSMLAEVLDSEAVYTKEIAELIFAFIHTINVLRSHINEFTTVAYNARETAFALSCYCRGEMKGLPMGAHHHEDCPYWIAHR